MDIWTSLMVHDYPEPDEPKEFDEDAWDDYCERCYEERRDEMLLKEGETE